MEDTYVHQLSYVPLAHKINPHSESNRDIQYGFQYKDHDGSIRKDFSNLVASLDDESTKDVDDAVAIDPNPHETEGIEYLSYLRCGSLDSTP